MTSPRHKARRGPARALLVPALAAALLCACAESVRPLPDTAAGGDDTTTTPDTSPADTTPPPDDTCNNGLCQARDCLLDADCPADVPWCVAGNCVACTSDTHCDDANPCTDDRCDLNQCIRSDNASPCEDGLFCNGSEACLGGACVSDGTSPCGVAMPCNEATRSCDECASDADCGAPSVGAWDVDCTPSCGTVTRTRTVTTPTCQQGACAQLTTTESETCPGLGEGERCADDGLYCGQTVSCHVCRSGSCAVNTPHYDASCLPSCGGAGGLCGRTAMCCPASAACSQGELGPTWDCAKCCDSTCN